MKIAFVGLGQMGKPMAMNLLKSGAELLVNSATDESYPEFEAKGARTTKDPKQVAEAEVIFLCLPSSEVVRKVVLGEQGLAERLGKGQTVVDPSTITYSTTLEVNNGAASARGRISRCADLWHGGARDRGHADRHVRRQAGDLRGGQALSRMHRQQDPLHGRRRQRPAHQAHQPAPVRHQLRGARRDPADGGQDGARPGAGGRGHQQRHRPELRLGVLHSAHPRGQLLGDGYPMQHAYKDLVSAAELGAKLGIPMPVLAAATATYQMALLKGHGERDKGGMIRVFEELLGVKFRKPTQPGLSQEPRMSRTARPRRRPHQLRRRGFRALPAPLVGALDGPLDRAAGQADRRHRDVAVAASTTATATCRSWSRRCRAACWRPAACRARSRPSRWARCSSIPTSMMFRNLMAMDMEEMIRAQPMDAVVLIGGCDKTVPAQLMGAASANMPAIQLVTGPMTTGRHKGERLGACTDCRRFWAKYRARRDRRRRDRARSKGGSR